MFHPVGPQPPSVYWRRRLLLLGSVGLLLVLLMLTAKIAASKGSDPKAAGSSTPARTRPVASTTHQHRSSSRSHSATHSSARSSTPASGSSSSPTASSSAAARRCDPNELAVAAVSARPNYHVGDQPVLELQVTNRGPDPCVQDLADRQVELRVYNGESRVWGSHDCQIQPGTNDRVLAVDTPVRVAITWSGLSSRPNCAGTRQRVGAGTYTLYAILSGHTGTATQFAIS